MSGEREGTIIQAGEVRSARLESLRALAALGVMAGHIFGQSRNYAGSRTLDTFFHRVLFGGGFGVFVFFGLTGYLLFWPFARCHFGGGAPIDLRRYALNRALRILPLYYAAVVILLLIQNGGGSFEQWWRFLTFSQSFSTRTVNTVDGPMWSLVVEVHFYLLLPLLAYGLAKAAHSSRARAAAILIALGVASYFARRHAIGPTGRRILLELSLPATFMYFVPGMLVALLRLQWEQSRPKFLRGPLAVGDLWLLAAVAFCVLQFRYYGSMTLIAIASFLAVGACVLPLRRGTLVRCLDWRPLAIVGVASYSLYIWHTPIVVWQAGLPGTPHSYLAQMAIAGSLSVAAALASYWLIEAPFLRLRRQWSPSTAAQPTAVEVALPASAARESVAP
jgi:peptidoglycan/LPS O-acetylase OafA/YrhL